MSKCFYKISKEEREREGGGGEGFSSRGKTTHYFLIAALDYVILFYIQVKPFVRMFYSRLYSFHSLLKSSVTDAMHCIPHPSPALDISSWQWSSLVLLIYHTHVLIYNIN